MDFSALFYVLLIIVMAFGLIAVAKTLTSNGSQALPVRAKPLLTPSQHAFFPKLQSAVSGFEGLSVHPKVAMGAIIQPGPGLDQKTRTSTHNRFSKKICTFVVTDPNTLPVLIVELDDRARNAEKAQNRDSITAAAGIPTVRLQGAKKLTVGQIKSAVRAGLEDPLRQET